MKNTKLILQLVASIAVLGLVAGCQSKGPKFDARAPSPARTITGTPVSPDVNPAWMQDGTNFFTLGPGDAINIEMLGVTNSLTSVTVGPDGRIYYYVLPGQDVWGLTLSETKEMLQRELSKYVTGVQVSVSLANVSSKSVWILGRVGRAGVFPMTGPMTVLEAISLAGGLADDADLTHSFVQRNGELLPVDFQKLLTKGDMSQNIYLQPDDFLYLPSTLFHEVFVLGAVYSPRTVPYSERLTLVSAISNARGPQPGAYLSHVAIVRGSLAEPKVAVVNYRDIIKGKDTDVRLEPHDIVYVPFEPFIGLKSYARSVLGTFVNTIAANEGARAVQENAPIVGIAVPPGAGGQVVPATSTPTQ